MVVKTFFVLSEIRSSSLKSKKARVFPMKLEDMFIAQKTPEFRVIVVGSELLASTLPWAVQITAAPIPRITFATYISHGIMMKNCKGDNVSLDHD